MSTARDTRAVLRQQRGVGLVEVLISVAIGTFLIAGALTIFSDSSKTYNVHEASSRLEENGRYVFSILEPDVRMASYWGYTKGAVGVGNAVAQTGTAATALAGAAATSCGNNYSVDLLTTLEGSNDSYTLGCAAYNAKPMPSADTLTVRRASFVQSAVTAATVGPLRICSTRLSALLTPVASACAAAPNGTVSDLIVHAYYVDQDSTTQAGLPTLWRKSLNTVGTTPTFQDEEILPGVEDLQVQFGIDPSGTSGVATQYINPLKAANLPATTQIVAVRIWVLLRADVPEPGFADSRIYQYGNRSTATGTVNSLLGTATAGKAYQPNDTFRRLLLSRTIMIRNSLGT
ncbi:MAG: PilW family protein [Pseudomonadota bacterium]